MQLKAFLKQEYGLQVESISAMAGYGSANYKVETTNGVKYVLKLHKLEKYIKQRLEAEHEMLALFNTDSFQKLIKNVNGETITAVDFGGFVYARLINFLEGTFLAENEQTLKLAENFGAFLANLNLKLLNFNHSAIEANNHVWDLKNALWSKPHLQAIKEGSKRKIPHHFFLQFQERVVSEIPNLRQAVIHGDANDWNVLTKGDEITGIIDFGDTCFSPLINEIAVALSYVLMNKEKPLEYAATFLAAYHKVLPLQEKEMELLYWLIPARLSVSVCQSAYTVQQNPNDANNSYIQISEKSAWDLLEKWITINPLKAASVFKKACGFPSDLKIDTEAETKRRWDYLGAAYSLTFKQGIKMEQSVFQYMYAADGTTYLDCYNNIPQVGHGHPVVVEAGQQQMAKLNTNSRYLYEVMHN